ncbi:MAG: lipopolysaccharide biosynthesis protein [Gammaproteobacteria bacterium GWF2_41_13]|nr:MAG: lipopolysaccharide biosynthesis protein [Gammaproteobacteria bacterium GWF2_41_13]
MKKVRCIAIYLPQFHPIPENDEWYGKGFTEWTNVTKAKSLFKGHYQPILPADLGFYDLRLSEVRIAQAELAKEYGIEAFCYWHYWFGNGRRILERPFQEVLESGKPDFPFCLAWANGSWTAAWYGMPHKILLKQEYPGTEDHKQHFYTLLSAFKDERYIRVNNKPLFFIYNPRELPNANDFMRLWNELAKKEGLHGMYFVGALRGDKERLDGYDATTLLDSYDNTPEKYAFLGRIPRAIIRRLLRVVRANLLKVPRRVIEYDDFVKYLNNRKLGEKELPLIMPNFDDTARIGLRGTVMINPTPRKFDIMFKNALKKIDQKSPDEKIIFIEAWNEWAEGNYLEPDRKFGRQYLDVVKNNVF